MADSVIHPLMCMTERTALRLSDRAGVLQKELPAIQRVFNPVPTLPIAAHAKRE